jgi:ABC-2 type transport system permease protein
LIQLLLLLGILILVNVLGNIFYTHFDLTEEKRFTLTEPTVELLHNLDEPVFVRVLLEGEFPAGFKRLQRASREMLDDFRAESKSFHSSDNQGWFKSLGKYFGGDAKLEYEFSNPNEGSVEEINARREELAKEGIVPTLFQLKDVEGTEQKLIYPYAVFNYKGRQVAVNMLENTQGMGQEEKLNNSISLLEYKFANAIQKLLLDEKPIIAFTTGHGEAEDLQTKDLVASMRAYYDFGRFDLDSNFQIPPQIDLLIVAKPRTSFSNQDKFKIDQYIMNGGKVMFLVDRLNASLDSMQRMDQFFVPRDYPTNLEDMLFKYGARIEPNLVLDLQCSKIPQVIGMQGGNPQIELFDWYYHPVITPRSDHPIVKGLGNLNLFFPSRVDTVKTKTPIKKTVLLTTSEYSREQYAPVRLSFDILRYEPDPSKFDRGELPVAVLLEGEFPSLFENRVSASMQAGLEQLNLEFKSRSVYNRMLVVSDGDLAINTVTNPETRGTLPLGYNRFERRQYANKDFLINAIEYLLDADGVIEARGKELKLRLLDQVRAQEEKTKWQLLNILVPLVFLGVFGFGFFYLRKRKYA